jgi:hypothetical protein
MNNPEQPVGDSSKPALQLITNPTLEDYLRERLANIREKLPILARALTEAGVCHVRINYDGCGDSGCIETIEYTDRDGKPVEAVEFKQLSEEELMDLFYDLTQARQPGWENCDGAYGEFRWDISTDSLHHQHNERFTDYDTTEVEGL